MHKYNLYFINTNMINTNITIYIILHYINTFRQTIHNFLMSQSMLQLYYQYIHNYSFFHTVS